jgi:hypothetical protein
MQNINNAAIFADSDRSVFKSEARARPFTLDTSFVLFFLAMDMGVAKSGLGLDTVVSGLTLAAFMVLPFFLPFTREKGNFARWLIGRVMIAAAGIMFGSALGQVTGNLLPEAFRFVPMSLLIVAAIICCNIQIYGILKLRLAS